MFKDVSPFVLISARWSPTIISCCLYARLRANSLDYALLPSSLILNPRFLHGEIGRTLQGATHRWKDKIYAFFRGSWRLMNTETGIRLPIPILPRRRPFLFSLFFFSPRTYTILAAFVSAETTLRRSANDSRRFYEYLTIGDYILTCNLGFFNFYLSHRCW